MTARVLFLRAHGPRAIGQRRRRRYAAPAVIAAGLGGLAAGAVLAWMSPWIVGFATAVGAATMWCRWLARNPDHQRDEGTSSASTAKR